MVIGSTRHPAAEQLRAFGTGRLPPEEAAAIEGHLSGCEQCCGTLEELSGDSFVERLSRVCGSPTPATDGYVFSPSAEDVYGGGDSPPSPSSEDIPPELLQHPRYRMLRLVGKGGMGSVYLAEHRRMGRPVALKVIDPGLLSHEAARWRFQHEVLAAAQLHHANIVAAYDADQAGELHFLVMEHVEGQNLADYLAEKGPLAVAQACDIARHAALGLQHAHDRGMVHRDIKPHNLMRTPSGQVKVLDFGLARFVAEPGGALAADRAPTLPHLTGVGAVMGTADYIAPEQARDAHGADARADVYSLGCTLYHLLAGRPPFPGGTAADKLSRHAVEEPTPLPALRPEVPQELAAVVGRMMAKRPEDRYQTAATAATALGPYVNAAQPAKVRRRRPVAIALVALAAVLLATAVGAAVVRLSGGAERSSGQPGEAQDTGPEEKVGEVRRFVGHIFHEVYGAKFTPDGRRVVSASFDRTVRVWDAQTGKELHCFLGHRNIITGLDVSPDGTRAVSASHDGTARVWDLVHYRELGRVESDGTFCPQAIAFAPDGRLALLTGWDAILRLLDLTEFKVVRQLKGHGTRPDGFGPIMSVAFSPDGTRAVSAGDDRTVRVWDVATGESLHCFSGHAAGVVSVAYAPDGRHVLSGGGDGTVRLWEVATGKEVRRFAAKADAVAFSPDGARILTGAGPGQVRLWDVASGEERASFVQDGQEQGWVGAVAFSPDGRYALSGGNDRTVHLWRLPEPPPSEHTSMRPLP
jgi:hypothetical protein